MRCLLVGAAHARNVTPPVRHLTHKINWNFLIIKGKSCAKPPAPAGALGGMPTEPYPTAPAGKWPRVPGPAPAGRLAPWLFKRLECNLFSCAVKSAAATVAESLPI